MERLVAVQRIEHRDLEPVTVTFQTVERASDIAEVEKVQSMERLDLVAVQRIEHVE